MSDLGQLLRRIRDDLERLGSTGALVGGLAVSVHTEPRFTRDVDLAVAVDDDEAAESLVRALVESGWSIHTTLEQDATHRLAAVRLGGREETAAPVADLLFASSGIEREIVEDADEVEVFSGVRMRVARIAHLIVLKLLAVDEGRPQDDADLAALLGVSSPEDRDQVRRLAGLVTERGYARDRDLLAMLAERTG